MIVKPYRQRPEEPSPRERAGEAAERQMAHYLHRRFKSHPEVHVLHGLRIEDRTQPEQDGSPGVCQIDHLIVHRRAMFIVESKSVTGVVRVRPDGSGGDEWGRVYRGREMGMASPIRQAERQSDFLRAFLERRQERLLEKMTLGRRALAKVVWGAEDQGGFRNAPVHLIIAISDSGDIRRIDDWKAPRKRFQAIVTKADLVPDKIDEELERHRKGANILNITQDNYGLWSMEARDAAKVAEFLAARHVERTNPAPARGGRATSGRGRKQPRGESSPAERPPGAVCRHCGSGDLTAKWGRFGYYWRCRACEKNTTMPKICSACGTERRADNGVRIRKDGTTYFRDCKTCGSSERIWMEK